MGSPANAAVRDYLVGELRGLGLTPQVQRATAAYYPIPGLLQAGTAENVLARLPGTNPAGKAFLLAAHYDSVPTGPGATDNGSGVASALETLRALRAGPPLRNDVIVLFTDGEERGLIGARAFVDQHPWASDVGVVLNLDTRGNTGPALHAGDQRRRRLGGRPVRQGHALPDDHLRQRRLLQTIRRQPPI